MPVSCKVWLVFVSMEMLFVFMTPLRRMLQEAFVDSCVSRYVHNNPGQLEASVCTQSQSMRHEDCQLSSSSRVNRSWTSAIRKKMTSTRLCIAQRLVF